MGYPLRRKRNPYTPRSEQAMNAALTDLPEIDYKKGRELLESDCFSVPEGWPRNWQWIVAMKEAQEKVTAEQERIATARQRIESLQLAIASFKDFLDRGWLWPGLEEHRVACLKGGYETVIAERRKELIPTP